MIYLFSLSKWDISRSHKDHSDKTFQRFEKTSHFRDSRDFDHQFKEFSSLDNVERRVASGRSFNRLAFFATTFHSLTVVKVNLGRAFSYYVFITAIWTSVISNKLFRLVFILYFSISCPIIDWPFMNWYKLKYFVRVTSY